MLNSKEIVKLYTYVTEVAGLGVVFLNHITSFWLVTICL